ncbi:MAG: MATE family efflux transporter [Spirochaetaceae bacterium]|nr:MAG: MATE family efflux transporter [Spirochaetaceae bacterium]
MFEGSVLRLLARLASPIFFGMLFQLLYNITDTIWVSRIDLADPSYVGGTGIIFPFLFLAIALSQGIVVGTSSLVARAIGERNTEVLDKTAESGLAIGVIVAVVMAIPTYIFATQILRLLGAEGDYLVHGLEYLRFIVPAGVLLFVTSTFFGILQGEGMMRYVMIAMIIGTAGNIILDPIFIFPLKLGVRGAALATTVAQGLSMAFILSVFIRRKTQVEVHWRLVNVDWRTIKKILAVGLPQSAGMILMALSFIFFNRVVVSIDPLALTAFALCGRLDQAVLMPIFAIGAALITMIGQNAGRGNFERVREIWRKSLLTATGLVVLTAALMFLLAPRIYPFFSDIDRVVRYAVLQTRIIEFTFVFAAIGILSRSFFQAIGYPFPALIITTSRLLLLAVPAMLLYVYIFDLRIYGVWLGIITGNLLAAGMSALWISRTLKLLQEGKLKTAKT